MRVCKDDWFADVPSSCDWVHESSTRVSVVTCIDDNNGKGQRLEMSGQVLLRDERRVVISCGGLIVSVVPSLVAPDVGCNATVLFTRS